MISTNAGTTGDDLSVAFEHSITWEDDIWRADPVDVDAVHAKARRKFEDLLATLTATGKGSGRASPASARMLLFHGQSGAGKTHLIRALRTSAHRAGKAYFGYAQMTPDIQNYADYYLRRLVHSLAKPYDPDSPGETGLARLTRHLVAGTGALKAADLEALREAALDEDTLARLVMGLADDIVASPQFSGSELDINIVRALLYLERCDPRIDQRIRQYLHGRQLTQLAHRAVGALDPNTGEDRSFEIIAALGQLIHIVDGAALVFCIDQVEDLRFFDDAEERFQRAVRDLIQITNRVTSSIVIITVLEDFYGQVRGSLAQSYIDRIEKAGPVQLLESRTPEEARLIISKRLENEAAFRAGGAAYADPGMYFGPEFYEEFGGLSTRRLLEHAQTRLRSKISEPEEPQVSEKPAWMSQLGNTLASAFGFNAVPEEAPQTSSVDYRDGWERFQAGSEAEMPSNDSDFLDLLTSALELARSEWGGAIEVGIKRLELGDQLPAFDVRIGHRNGLASETRIFICNRPTQGGGLKRQLDKVLASLGGRSCILVRASDFPPPGKNQTGQAMSKFRTAGGRTLLVPIPEWERMLTVSQFHADHRADPGFTTWFEGAKLLSSVHAISRILRLETLVRPSTPLSALGGASEPDAGEAAQANGFPIDGDNLAAMGAAMASWGERGADSVTVNRPANDDELPISVLLEDDASSICAGREPNGRRISLNTSVLKRHAAVLGGSGSGKTTLALSIIEQLLQRGIPAILIDRKGDLASYANPDVWRANIDELSERRGDREKLADKIDVAVYTPGRSSGRPISITLLPRGINELPDHEQQLLANLSAAALGDMLHLGNSATHQKLSGTLSVALRVLGMRNRGNAEVTLADLIHLLEDEDPDFTDLTQRMDPSGRFRRDLVGQLDSLRLRNAALFDPGGETMNMESLLGIGPHARTDASGRNKRTRLSIIYTGFLGDNENILFWVAQFLSEALRFCQRNPNDELQAVVMFDEADLYIPANSKPATAEPLQSLLKRARSAGLGIMLATQSPGDIDYRSRDQITSWFIGRVREDTALKKLKAAFQSESGLDAVAVLPNQTVGEFHLVQEGLVRAMRAQRSLISAEQVPFDRIEQLAFETKGQDERQLRLFDIK